MPATAATEIGTTFDPGASSCGNLVLQSASPPGDTYAVPFPGVITSWSYQASQGGRQLRLKVGRAAGGNNFFIVAETAIETAAAAGSVNSFLSRISVQAGDVIGIRPVKIGVLGMPCIRMMAGYSYSAYVANDDLAPGITATFNPPVADVQLDVAATLEVDADGDGFGDESQDQCLGTPGPTDGCPLNTFSFGRLKRNERNGTAILTVVVPGPGTVALAGTGLVGQGPVSASGAAKAMKRAVSAAGDVKFKVRSRGNKKRTLNRTGEVKVKASGFRVSRLAGHRTGINPYLGAARD